jgi:hypothetical protein
VGLKNSEARALDDETLEAGYALRMADKYDPPRIESRTSIVGSLMVALASNQVASAAFRPL